MKLQAKATLLCATLLLVSEGCAHGATASAMTLTAQDLAGPPSPAVVGAVSVGNVSGGEATNPMGRPQIDDASFREALVASLRLAGVLAERPDAPLVVHANIVKLDQPVFGFDMTVTSIVRYTVRETRSGAVVIDEQITAPYTAKMGDAFSGTTRLQLANEGSARRSISLLVQRLNTIRRSAPAPAATPPPAPAAQAPATPPSS